MTRQTGTCIGLWKSYLCQQIPFHMINVKVDKQFSHYEINAEFDRHAIQKDIRKLMLRIQ